MKLAALTLTMAMAAPLPAGTREEALLDAVRRNDAAAVKALLDEGVPVDTKFRYDRTALSFAADRGDAAIVKLLLDRGADPDAVDTFYKNSAMGWAAYKGHAEVVRLLLERSQKGVASALLSGLYAGKPEVVDVALATGKISARDLSYALATAEKAQAADIAERLRKAGAVPPPKADAVVDASVLARYAGRYREEKGKEEFTLAVADGGLTATFGGRTFKLGAIDAQHFQHLEAVGVTLEMRQEGERVVGATVAEIGSETRYVRVEEAEP